MNKKIILTLLIFSALLLLVFQIIEEDSLGFIVRAIAFPLLTLLYYIKTKDKKSSFFYFLLFFSISELLGVFIYMAHKYTLVNDLMYYIRNSLYIIAYAFLFIKIATTINFKENYKRLWFPGLILLFLSIYIIIYMSSITLNSDSFGDVKWYDYVLVITYNTIIKFLLTAALLSYLSKDSKKRIILFFGVLCIVFSEMIQIASFYLVSQKVLDITHTLLIILGFSFLYFQFELNYSEKELSIRV